MAENSDAIKSKPTIPAKEDPEQAPHTLKSDLHIVHSAHL